MRNPVHRPKFFSLQIAFRLLIILLAATPALAIAHNRLLEHAVAAAAALILIAAATAPQTDVSTAAPFLKRISLAIAFPALWMVLQLVPLPFPSLVNPIWSTASTALGESLVARVSIDPGATLRSLIVYLTMLSLLVSTVIVARDRRRAEMLFYALTTVTTFMAAETLIGQFHAFAGVFPSTGSTAASAFTAMAALSAIANGAAIIMAIERHLSSRDAENVSRMPLLARLALAACGLAIALVALESLATGGMMATIALGLAAIIIIAVGRRLEIRPWPAIILFAFIATVAVTMSIPRLQGTSSPTIAGFATFATSESRSVAQRATADTPWLGNGVGVFRSLEPIYRDFGAAPIPELPSTAVEMAIEWGRPALVILVLIAIQLFVLLFRGAVRRGRDSYFAAAAAGGVLVLLCEVFFDQSLLNATVQIAAAVMTGLGIAQSAGRTSGLA